MATSKFIRYFQSAAGVPITLAKIWIVPQANEYPTNALELTKHATRTGQYYRDAISDGEYKIYIDAAGGTSPTLYEQNIWIGEKRISDETTLNTIHKSSDGSDHSLVNDNALAISNLDSALSLVEAGNINKGVVETSFVNLGLDAEDRTDIIKENYYGDLPTSKLGDVDGWGYKCWGSYSTVIDSMVVDKLNLWVASAHASQLLDGNIKWKVFLNGSLIDSGTIDNSEVASIPVFATATIAQMKITTGLNKRIGLKTGDNLSVFWEHSGNQNLCLVYNGTGSGVFAQTENYFSAAAIIDTFLIPPITNSSFYVPFSFSKITSMDIRWNEIPNNIEDIFGTIEKNGGFEFDILDRIIIPNGTKWNNDMTFIRKNWGQWFVGIEQKIFNAVGIFLIKDFYSPNDFTDDIVVKIFVKGDLIKTHTINISELAIYNALSFSDPLTDFEYIIDLPFPVKIDVDDEIFIGYECTADNDKISMAYQVSNFTNEWAGKYTVSSNTANYIMSMNSQPALPTAGAFCISMNAYYKRYTGEIVEELNLLIPKKIYTVKNNVVDVLIARHWGASIYLDHFINGFTSEPNIAFKENNSNRLVLTSPQELDQNGSAHANPTEEYSKTFSINGGGKYSDAIITVEQKSTLQSANPNIFPKILCIGDSVTGGTGSSTNYEVFGLYTYWQHIKNEFEKDKIDNGGSGFDCLMIGKTDVLDWNLTYGGETDRSLRACAEGVGGWSSATHLYWSRGWTLYNSQGMFDLLGLGNGSGSDYTGSAIQLENISTTPEGYFAPKNTPSFVAYINSQLGATAATYAAAVAVLDDLESNPENPFYSLTTAAGGVCSFSILAYLNRYKTLANDGISRLNAGSTAGTEVVDVNNYDVCLPTHIIIQHSHNDGAVSWFPSNIRKLTNAIKSEYLSQDWGDIIIGISIVDEAGTYFPNKYPEFDKSIKFWEHVYLHNAAYQNQQSIFNEFWISSANEDSEKIFLLPTFHVQPPAYGMPFRETNPPEHSGIDGLKNSFKMPFGAACNWHPNQLAHKSWGVQMWAWIKYTLTL